MKKLFSVLISFVIIFGIMTLPMTVDAKTTAKSKKNITMIVGQKKNLKTKKISKKAKYRVTNKKVLKVSKKGVAYAKKLGKTRVVIKNGKEKINYNIKVVDRFKLKSTNCTVLLNTSKKLGYSGGYGKIKWKSSKPNIVTVSNNGTLKGLSQGTAIVSATRNKKTQKCRITVTNFDKNKDYYYNSLESAVLDANNNFLKGENSTNAVKVKFDGKAYNITLLKNLTLNNNVTIAVPTNIKLNGYLLTLKENASLISNSDLKIDGTVQNSAIRKTNNSTMNIRLIESDNGNLDITGGTYSVDASLLNPKETSYVSAICCFKVRPSKNFVSIRDVNVNLTYGNKNTSHANSITAMKLAASNCKYDLDNVKINATNKMQGTITGISSFQYKMPNDITISNSQVNANGDLGCSVGFSSNGNAIINNSNFYADASNNDTVKLNGIVRYGIGIINTGTLTFNSGVVKGTHAGMCCRYGAKTYVNGGSFDSSSHGGIYFAQGPNGLAYVRNATITCNEYWGKYDSSKFTNPRMGGFYIGGGTSSSNSNNSVYMDNCKISGGNAAFVLRGSSGEKNNKLYISNSILEKGRARIDNNQHLYVGVGTNIDDSKVTNKSLVTYTNENYSR